MLSSSFVCKAVITAEIMCARSRHLFESCLHRFDTSQVPIMPVAATSVRYISVSLLHDKFFQLRRKAHFVCKGIGIAEFSQTLRPMKIACLTLTQTNFFLISFQPPNTVVFLKFTCTTLWYCVLAGLFDHHIVPYAEDPLSALMNGDFKDYLQIIPDNVTWGSQSGDVFDAMNGDFMKPAIDIGTPSLV